VWLDDVHRAFQPFRHEQGESGLVLNDAIGGIRFVRELEANAPAGLTDDPHTHVGVETPGGCVGPGQDLDRPSGERQHAPSLGARDPSLRAGGPARVTGYDTKGGFEVTCNLHSLVSERWHARW
jgi:hypothetical protein